VKIYIMTDMEGVAGILDHDNWCAAPERGYPGRYYDLGRELLTREVNAAIDGICQAGATEIVVSDGHGQGGIHPVLLDRRAQLTRGFPSGWPGVLDASFDAVMWIGQHAKAGTPYAHLAHTQSFRYLEQRINGVAVGEFGQLLFCASELGVPAIFGSGDEAFCREAAEMVPGIVTVAVKRGLTPDDGRGLTAKAYGLHNLGAVHLHPEVARDAIREQAAAALVKLRTAEPGFGLVALDPPYERVTRFRPEEEGQPHTIDRAEHPTSVVGVLNRPFHPVPAREERGSA